MKNYDYIAAGSLEEAARLAQEGGTHLLAGGTDLFVHLRRGKIAPQKLIDLKTIPRLSYVAGNGHEGLRIGALTPLADLQSSLSLLPSYRALAEAAASIGSVQIRNKGTAGGNLCNASPAADLAPPLLVLEARVKLLAAAGERWLVLKDWFHGPGETDLKAGEILTEILVPALPPRTGAAYVKFSRRRGMDLSVAGAACLLALTPEGCCQQARIALGAVAPTPRRAPQAEALLRGQKLTPALMRQAAQAACSVAQPIDDLRASAAYRLEILQVLVRRGLELALQRAGEAGKK